MEIKSRSVVHGGQILRITHQSTSTKTPMTFAIYLPHIEQDFSNKYSYPALFYLSGLTCTDENVCHKANPFRKLAQEKIAFIAPDTSPRGLNIPGDSDSYDFGVGAGFYLNATEAPWNENYQMYTYINEELPEFIKNNFPCINLDRLGIFGHSMGGHGALTIALKNQDKYKSVSAFCAIANPMNCPWGQKAFNGYLGSNQELWKNYDATELIKFLGKTKYDTIFLDYAEADNFLKTQLLHENFLEAARSVGQPVEFHLHAHYDHSYYFISTFMEDHIEFHARRL